MRTPIYIKGGIRIWRRCIMASICPTTLPSWVATAIMGVSLGTFSPIWKSSKLWKKLPSSRWGSSSFSEYILTSILFTLQK